MKKSLVFGFFIFSIFSIGQIKHTVVKGETLYSISQKYSVKPEEIINLNPESKAGVKEFSVLNIPAKSSSVTSNTFKKFEYIVQQGETLYSISKKLNVKVEDLEQLNPEAKSGVKAGQTLFYSAAKPIANLSNQIVKKPDLYTIQAEETKYSVSKKFGISIAELETLNPQIKNSFEIGATIRLTNRINLPTTTPNVVTTSDKTMNYTVQQSETLYSISRKFGISVEEILKRNPSVTQGLNTGITLILPEKKEVVNPAFAEKKKLD